ncbi:hypothetical protein ACFLZM_08945 [Thermodesulfobacteriota bacterium]
MKQIGWLVAVLFVLCMAGCEDKKTPSSESAAKKSAPAGKTTVGQFSLSAGQKVDVSIKAAGKTWVGIDVETFGVECALRDKNSSQTLVARTGREVFAPVDGSIELTLSNVSVTVSSKVVVFTEPYTD